MQPAPRSRPLCEDGDSTAPSAVTRAHRGGEAEEGGHKAREKAVPSILHETTDRPAPQGIFQLAPGHAADNSLPHKPRTRCTDVEMLAGSKHAPPQRLGAAILTETASAGESIANPSPGNFALSNVSPSSSKRKTSFWRKTPQDLNREKALKEAAKAYAKMPERMIDQ